MVMREKLPIYLKPRAKNSVNATNLAYQLHSGNKSFGNLEARPDRSCGAAVDGMAPPYLIGPTIERR
jgi:hypothetical protein